MSHIPPRPNRIRPLHGETTLPQPTYRAFLLRYWCEGEEGNWRCWVQDVATGAQYGFAEVDLLLAFLSQQVGEGAEPPPPSSPLS
jgi:subtilisin-like proprotein convertase family protein